MRLAIVGGGAAGVALLDSLHRRSGWHDLQVSLYEPTGDVGPGRAYREENEAALINRQSELMSVRDDDPGHFMRWLRTHPDQAIAQYAVPGSFAPRSVFGSYLRDCARSVISSSMNVSVIPHRAVEVARLDADRLAIRTDDGSIRHHEAIVLCVGTAAPLDVFGLASTEGHFIDPYPLSTTFQGIDRTDDVLVVGTGLTAVDVALGLLKRGHEGRLFLSSRWGLLPSVRQLAQAQPARFLTQQVIHMLLSTGPLRLSDVGKLLMCELAELGYEPDVLLAETCIQTPKDRLLRHLNLAHEHTPWQATLLDAVKDVASLVWANMDAATRKQFLAAHHRHFQSLCNPMPAASARSLLAAMCSGQLEVLPGLSSVAKSTDAGFGFSAAGVERHVDVVVNTAQSAVKPVPFGASELVSSLLDNALARQCAWGGLDVDPMTNAIVSPSARGMSPRIFALGELAVGTLYYVSSLKMITSWVEATTEQLDLLRKGLA